MKLIFPFNKISLSALFVLGLCFFAEESFAQSSQEKVDLENVKPSDKPMMDDQVGNSESLAPKILAPKPLPSTNNNKVAVKRDLPAGGVDKEVKKEEGTPSTLSFNIFLYIVDKFKAD